MPVPSSLEVLDPAYAKTIRIIVRLRRRCSQSRDHSAILKLSPRSNRANNSVCFSFHDSFELWWCEKLAIFFRDRKNYWNYCELFQCRGGNGNRSMLKDCLAKANKVRLQTTRFYYACGLVFISRFIFVRILFFFLSFSFLVMFKQLFLYYCNEVIV